MGEIARKVDSWRKRGESIVFTNGCFDLLHLGHIEYLSQTADLGDRLIVGVNSDSSVQQLGKGNLRPIKDEKTRASIIAALGFVSAVVIFSEDTPYDLITRVMPDVLVKGGDWKKADIIGSDLVEANGGRVQTIAFLEGHSTTNYVEKIQNGKS